MNAAGPPPGEQRIAFLIDRWQPTRGGAERALAQFAAHLVSRGHEVHAFGLVGPRPDEAAPGEFHRVPARGWRRGARERSFAEDALAAAEAAGCALTVGVRHLPRVDLYWPHGGAHAETLALLGKAPRGRHRSLLALERELLEGGGARRVVCVSAMVREELARHYPACGPRLCVIPNAVDLARFHPDARAEARTALRARFTVSPRGPVLGFVGRNAWLKGLDVLIEALAGLGELPWSLVIAGPARLRPWRRAAARAGLAAERLLFARELPALELAAGVDLAVVPTRRDTSSLALLEALAAGTPVLASARAGAADCLSAAAVPCLGAAAAAGEILPATADAADWRAALARWIERLRCGPIEHGLPRACVEGRDVGGWLAALERELMALAPERPLP